jgi:hypothetical protein
MKKEIVIFLVLVFTGLGFFGGVYYQKSRSPRFAQSTKEGNFERRGMAQMPQSGSGGMVRGEIIAKDKASLTLKTTDGSSKIIFLGTSTKINKTEKGSASDLEKGKQVTIFGAINQDGSITAENVQLGSQIMKQRP